MKLAMLILSVCALSVLAGPPKGKPQELSADDSKALDGLKGKIKGQIVWSTSREGNHDIWIMNADGTDPKPLTKGPKTDWYSRFSPDGKKVIFTRSKMDWTAETNAETAEMWDTWIINSDGSDEKLLIPNSDWAEWRPDGKAIVFARGTEVYLFEIEGNKETKLVDSKTDGFEKAATLQNPHLSPDGNYMAITLRGKMRETGIWDLKKKSWYRSGEGCQINWFPAGDRVLRMNPTGNGGSEVFSFFVKDGKPVKAEMSEEEQRFMDLPGRISHEYFPQVSPDSKWMIWCSTQSGHDHDIAPYEIFLWELGTPQDKAIRLTFHSGNDRWPDIFIEK